MIVQINNYGMARPMGSGSSESRDAEYQTMIREMMMRQNHYEEIYQRINMKAQSTPKSIINW